MKRVIPLLVVAAVIAASFSSCSNPFAAPDPMDQALGQIMAAKAGAHMAAAAKKGEQP